MKNYRLLPLLFLIFLSNLIEAQGVEITDRLSAQQDLPSAAQIIDNKFMPIGSGTSITSLYREVVNNEVVYHFEADETANRVELTTCFGEEANLVGISTQEREDLSALKNLYKYDYEGNYGETVTYEWSTLFPEALDSNSAGIFAQWHGRPDRTLFKSPDGLIKHYTEAAALSMLDTMYFTEHLGYSTATDALNGWEMDASAGGPIGAFKITEGYMTLVVRSDHNRMSNSLTKVKPTPGQHLYQEIGTNGKTGTVVFERPVEQVPINQWINFKVRIKYSDYNTEEDEVTRTGRVEVWVDGEKVGDWTGNVGKNDLKGPYFKCGIYKPGVGGFKNSVKNIRQYYDSAPDIDQTLEPIADSFISGDINAGVNYNTDNRLLSKGGNGKNDRSSFLKFDLSGIDIGKVESATLRLTPVAGKTWTSSTTGLWYVSDDSWTEIGLIYNNAPTNAVSLGTINNSSGGAVEEFDITNQVQQESDGILSLKITGSNGGGTSRQYNSREYTIAADRPLLILTMKSLPEAAFKTEKRSLVEGEQIAFTDLSLKNPTSWNWTFPGGSPATSTDQSPSVTYSAPGEYKATLTVSNADGTNTLEKDAHINVISYFESTADFILEPIADAKVSGGSNADVNYGTDKGLQSKNGSGSNHKYSFLKYDLGNFSPAAVEKVILRLTPVDGLTWSSSDTEIYSVSDDSWTEAGLTYNNMPSIGNLIVERLNSTGGVIEEFDLTNHASQENDGLLSLMIASTNGGGTSKEFNSREYDDAKDRPMLLVKLYDKPTVAFESETNDIYTEEAIDFTDLSTNNPSTWQWTFPGGTPSTSTAQNPTVVYNTPGIYSVTLSATNAGGTTTLVKSDLIVVKANELSLEPSDDSYVVGGSSKMNVNYGAENSLFTKNGVDGNDRSIYVKFDLSTVDLTDVVEAKFLLSPVDGLTWNSTDTALYYVNDDNWTESTITYNNMPAIGSLLATVTNSAGGAVETFDVTSAVQLESNDILSLVIKGKNGGGTAKQFYSKEYTTVSERPVLKLKFASDNTASKTTNIEKINATEISNNLGVYPNPVKDALFVSYKTENEKDAVLTIYHTTGGKVLEQNTKFYPGNNTISIDVSGLNAGIYVLHLNLEYEIFYTQILIE